MIIANSDYLLHIHHYCVNATSLKKNNALQLLQSDILSHNVDIILITETWFSSKQADTVLSLQNFNLFRLDRKGRRGGGVSIYVNCDVSATVIEPSPYVCDVEVLWLKCTMQKCVFCIACCYHPPRPRYDPSLLADKLTADLSFIIHNYTVDFILIAGNFNTLDTGFLEVDYGLTQLVTEPTHERSILDKVFVSRPDIYTATVFSSLLKTKHNTAN